eukprot:gnl/TRDRNA2_/TRDRNA2_158014_c0_seq1.p1 gnl/TRDRNA2_/TRDRNA2_158014_c0~~gnl/TRDRNA2_/TRDRNA2_158014_c0_seq1.p1  ORF type:complete len:707 (-),score=202.09 gnl/TRDRNA2_/TRDRNA2_158014_c0_seq1:139-2196(-)
MAPVVIRVCQGSSCSPQGAANMLRDLEDLAGGACGVEPWGCLGKCGNGPNVEVSSGAKTKIHQGIKNFKKAESLLTSNADVDVSDLERKVGKIKFAARRDDDPAARMKGIEDGFKAVGGEDSSSQPHLVSQLLVMRSKELLKGDIAKAVLDAERAVHLMPSWAHAHITLATALEAAGRVKDGIKAMNAALEIGAGIDKAGAKRQLKRLERKGEDTPMPEAAAPPPPAAPAPAPAEPTPAAAEPAKKVVKEKAASTKEKAGATKRSASTPKKAAKAKATEKKSGSEEKPIAVESAKEGDAKTKEDKQPVATKEDKEVEEDAAETGAPPEFVDWTLDLVEKLNHDCLRMVLRCKEMAALWKFRPVDDIWHIDILAEVDEITHEEVQRSYTPVSSAEEYRRGELELMVKVYPKGKMTQILSKLKVGAELQVSSPIATKKTSEFANGVVMIAGGSAVTVALQVCEAVLRKNESATAHLALCNRKPEDVLYQDRFSELSKAFPTSFRMVHCISSGILPFSVEGAAEWRAGRLSREFFANIDQAMKAVVSGPPGLCHSAMSKLKEKGYAEQDIHVLDALPSPDEIEPATRTLPPPPVFAPIEGDMAAAKETTDKAQPEPIEPPPPPQPKAAPPAAEEQATGLLDFINKVVRWSVPDLVAGCKPERRLGCGRGFMGIDQEDREGGEDVKKVQ